jgi:hypothetical protein
MTTEHDDEQIKNLLTAFEEKYHKVLLKLDSLSRGTFDEDDASAMAAACLLAQAALLSDLSSTDLKSRALKRDIDFAKANAYAGLKNVSIDGKKVTESALAHLILRDDEVRRISIEQNEAERDYKHLSNIHALLKEAHLTFRSIKKPI